MAALLKLRPVATNGLIPDGTRSACSKRELAAKAFRAELKETYQVPEFALASFSDGLRLVDDAPPNLYAADDDACDWQDHYASSSCSKQHEHINAQACTRHA